MGKSTATENLISQGKAGAYGKRDKVLSPSPGFLARGEKELHNLKSHGLKEGKAGHCAQHAANLSAFSAEIFSAVERLPSHAAGLPSTLCLREPAVEKVRMKWRNRAALPHQSPAESKLL